MNPVESDRDPIEPTTRILVTGASGFLGKHLVHRLLGEGHRVRALVRSAAKAADLERYGAQIIVGDITDRRTLGGAIDGVSVVYNLAGRLYSPSVEAEEYRKIHVLGTRLLLECCLESARIARLVHCSTTGVFGASGDDPIPEDAPMAPTNAYEATKAEAELEISAAAVEGFPAVIARPGLVYGPGDLHLLGFYRAVLAGRFWPIGRRPVWLHPIYIDDMTEALWRCGTLSAALGETFNLAGMAPVTLADLAATIAAAGGAPRRQGVIPLPAARLVALVGDLLPTSLRSMAPLTTSRLDFLTNSRVYDVSKAARLLAFKAETDLPSGTAATLAWYRQQRLMRPRDSDSAPVVAR